MKLLLFSSLFIISCLMCLSCNQRSTEKQILGSVDLQIDSLMFVYNIPSVAYGVIKNDSVILENVMGYRDIELKNEAQLNDLFHIGSNTKAVTSFIAAKLVEQGKIAWNTKFFDLYPELKDGSNPTYEFISLQELLSHRARLISFKDQSEMYPIIDYEKDLDAGLSLQEKRYFFVQQILKYKPIPEYEYPDDRYSNAGYIAASLMLEKASGKTWKN